MAEWPEWATVEDDKAPAVGDGHGSGSHTDETAEHAETGHEDGHGAESGLPEVDDAQGHDDHGDEGSHDDQTGLTPERPRAQVLGSFAVVNAAVLLVAAAWRRRTKGELLRRRSSRAAALHGTTGPTRSDAQTPDPSDP